jgi:hypothetical protein
LRAALGVSRAWMGQAACHGQTGERYYAWRLAPKEKVTLGSTTYKGSELIPYALEVCLRCPVQWACAGFAIETEASVGTWGCRFTDLKALKENDNWREMLQAAEAEDIPVQILVRVANRAA